MKREPLTIDELRALKAGDWVWVIIKQPVAGDFPHDGRYYQSANYEFMKNKNKGHVFNGYSGFYPYSAYGTKWVAYKNKEQAEAKGEIVELPCDIDDRVYIIDNDRHWAQIDMIHIYNEHNGSKKIVFEWVQLDVGVDVTEVWDEGEFDIKEIGKTILLEKVHNERIQQLIREENLRYAQWEEESERRLAELKGEE